MGSRQSKRNIVFPISKPVFPVDGQPVTRPKPVFFKNPKTSGLNVENGAGRDEIFSVRFHP
jgi:hypothetical protein